MDKYIFYKRKSSDSEDKQVMSLDSQDRVIKESIPSFVQLNIIANYEESKSAKAPGRPKFNEMCEKLERGEGQFIICWQLNRLARNPVDGGRIIWLVQNFGIKIVTPSKIYDVNDILLMYVEFAMSNQFINDLKKSTARGIEDKLRAGIAPILAPIGYYNDVTKKQGLRDILPDPDRFSLVRKMWDLLLTGRYSPPKILDIATNEWDLKRRNGKPISRSRIYEVFNTLFYTGQFEYSEKTYQGIHKPMITIDEYEKAQKILGKKGKQGLTRHFFAFGGSVISCICGGSITADERFRKVCPVCHLKYNSTKNDKCPKCNSPAPEKTSYFCYYHCAKRVDPTCKQPYINERDLVKQFDGVLATITLPEEFTNWALKQLEEISKLEVTNRGFIYKNKQASLIAVSQRIDNLLTKYVSESNKNGDLISDEEYKRQKELLLSEKHRLEEAVKGFSIRQNNFMEKAEEAFDFAKNARYKFNHGTKEDRRVLASSIGLNPILDNKILHPNLQKPYIKIKEAADKLKNPKNKLEPTNKIVREGQTYYFDPENPVWGDWAYEFCTQLNSTTPC